MTVRDSGAAQGCLGAALGPQDCQDGAATPRDGGRRVVAIGKCVCVCNFSHHINWICFMLVLLAV